MNVEPWSTVGPGDTGLVVEAIQYLLRAGGRTVGVDGHFGQQTAEAVTSLQSVSGLTEDGIVGPSTWPRLAVATRAGSSGDAVRAVQLFGLPRFPEDDLLVVDGVYGPLTAERVTFFQESWGLTADGIAGREVWSFLGVSPAPGRRFPWPLVKQGQRQSSNWRVLTVQYLLRHHGASIAADGDFGPLTGKAVEHFQQQHRAQYISSTVGQLDWPELIVTVREGDSGDAVRAIQVLLGVTVDGVFGAQTDTAVREFQDVFAPPSDGVVGQNTWYLKTLRIFD